MHMQPVYKGHDFITAGDNVGEDIFRRGLCLPSDIKNDSRATEQSYRVYQKML